MESESNTGSTARIFTPSDLAPLRFSYTLGQTREIRASSGMSLSVCDDSWQIMQHLLTVQDAVAALLFSYGPASSAVPRCRASLSCRGSIVR